MTARIAFVVAMCAATAAHAGRTQFGWLYDTETIPERTVELQSWVQEEDGKGGEDETLVWWAPVFGLTDRLELALPVELTYTRTSMGSSTQLERFGVELHWRLTDPDPVESGPFAPLLRLAVKRPVDQRDTARIEGGAVFSLDVGRVHLATDLGVVATIDKNGDGTLEAHPAAGLSVQIVGELRLGAEILAELPVGDSDDVSWVAVGPNLSFTHGRSWLSASMLIGARNIDAAPRLNWAIAF